jgi:hypothetical protein
VTEPQPAPNTGVNMLSIAALVVGAVSIFFNPYLLVSVIAIVLGIIGLVRANRAGDRSSRLIAILGIVAGAAGAVFVIVSNTISALL